VTRDVGQLTARGTLLGLAAVVVIATVLVGALDLLIDVREVTLEAPAEPAQRTCEELRDTLGAEPWRVTSSELIECPRFFDGRRVAYTGEAVRAVLRRDDRAWVNLNDDPYGLAIGPLPEHRTAIGGNSGIPVSVPIEAAERITHVGDHSHLGDALEVEGVFLRADPSDGGGPAIQADTVTIARVGRRIERSASPGRIAVAALGLLAAGVFTLFGRVTGHQRAWLRMNR
jgi:hypothetical protein